ncbi:MAG: acyl-CoA dehydrogenase, partial [Mycobacterium sp.]|nr:acyl-CoA dehydrogenase [Mycobacterium sp.]
MSTTAYRSTWADDDVISLKEMATKFFETEALPHRERWAAQKCVDRDFWYKAGELGLLCTSVPEEYGGGGGTLAHDFAVMEAQAACGESGFGNQVHSGLVAHYILAYGTDEQKRRWLPGMASGKLVSAIAMTEPGGGSDLKALRTSAIREGDHYRLNGAKTFTSNGSSADLIVLVVKTDPTAGAKGVSLLVLETADAPGFRVGRVLEKVGMKAQDTAELFFDDVLVPVENLLGEEGAGYGYAMRQLAHERLVVAVWGTAVLESAVEE